MKKLYFFITFLFLTTPFMSAQTEVVDTGALSNPARILLEGNTLYIANSGDGTVSTIDVTATLPTTKVNLVTGLNTPYGLYFSAPYLYIADATAIYQKEIVSGNHSTPLVKVADISDGADLAFNGGYLYYSEYFLNRISRVDITGSFPATPEVVATNIPGASGIVFEGNALYVSSWTGNSIFKIADATIGLPIDATGLEMATATEGIATPDGMYLDGSTLYMGLSASVSTIDVNAVATAAVIVGSTATISDVELSGTDLYYADINTNKIYYYDLSTASVKDYKALGINMYPNPSNDYITIAGLTTSEKYVISNVLGANVQEGIVSQNENIDVKKLNKGVYFVKLENGASLKFLKN